MWAFFTSKIPYKFTTAQKVISVHKSIGGDTQIYLTSSILSNHVDVVLNDKQILLFIYTIELSSALRSLIFIEPRLNSINPFCSKAFN